MIDLMLRFGDEAEWARLGLKPDRNLLIDIVGTIRKPIQQSTDDGDQVMRAVPGWHVNIRCSDDRDLSMLDAVAVTPDEPARIWA